MQFHRVKAARYGAIENLQVSGLAPGLNVVLGPNGSGKTSLLRFARELLTDSIAHDESPRSTPAATGFVEAESGNATVRVIRIARPGQPDTVATVAGMISEIDDFRDSQPEADPQTTDLVRYVEIAALHQSSKLACIAEQLTHRLCANEIGGNWSLAQSLTARPTKSLNDQAALVRVLRHLPDTPGDESTDSDRSSCDLSAIDANWRTAIDALSKQREHLRLQRERLVRFETRRQREWQTQVDWLFERANRQSLDIDRLDLDWQAAACDLAEHCSVSSEPAVSANGPQSDAHAIVLRDVDRSVALLAEVLEDLSSDRLHVMLRIAKSSNGASESLQTELQRIDGCEREVVLRMQHLRQRRRPDALVATEHHCPTCGTPRTEESPESKFGSHDAALNQRSADLQQRLFATRAGHAATCRRIARLEALRRRTAEDAAIDRLGFEMSELDAQLEELEARRQADMTARAMELRRRVGRRHDLMRRAGQNLSRLTSARYTSLRWSDDQNAVLAAGADAEWAPVDSLSRGTSEQVAMSLRLAILHAFSKLGRCGPVLWDEPLADSDEQRLTAAAELLAESGQEDMQMVIFTCREHVAQAMQAAGAKIHRLESDAATDRSSPLPRVAVAQIEDDSEADASTASRPSALSMRVLPRSAYWLSRDAALEQAPSISQQMARRLRALGVADIADLLAFDPAANAVSLADVQISSADVQLWQAEARLLTEVPELTGRDAQLLVSCGVMTRGQLADANVDALTNRVDRLRGGDTLRWRAGPSTAPHRETIERWIDSARGTSPADPTTRMKPAQVDAEPARRGRIRRAHRPHSSASPNPRAMARQFRLQPDSPIADAPSIGRKTAGRLIRVGISTVRDLLVCDAEQIASRLRRRRITAETVLTWQRQAGLMCSVPELRSRDSIVLVACGINGPLDLRRISASALHATLEPFIASSSGQRLLKGAHPPSFDDMSRWIDTVEESRVRRAA